MPSFATLLVAACAVVSVAALPTPTSNEVSRVKRANTPDETGTNGGYYYQFWSQGGGTFNYENGPGGNYQVTWDLSSTSNPVGDLTAGKGWSKAEPRNISFSGEFSVTAGTVGYLAIYTWSGSGETYIMEDFGSYNPGVSQGTHEGTLVSDGGTYDVYMVNRGNNYIQYWSIRQTKRTSGVVTTANHYNWYASHGLTHNPLSAAAYQILATEGYASSGVSNFTVGLA